MNSHETDPKILNEALNLSLRFGSKWRQSIAPELLARYPTMLREQSDALAIFAAETRDWAHRIVAACVADGSFSEVEARQQIAGTCPWLDADTLERLWNQGCYLAMKQ